jgi:arylsulfatase
MSLYNELKRRNVFRVAIAYLALAWLVIQVAGTLFPAFGVPDWGVRFVVIVVALGFLPALKGEAEWPRKEFLYWTDDGSLASLRYNQWKVVFLEQRAHSVWVRAEPFVQLRLPKLFNLRSDPFETADHEAISYEKRWFEHLFVMGPAQAYVGNWLQSFAEFPPRQKPGSFNLDAVMDRLTEGATN